MSNRPASLARLTTPCANGPSKNSGKMVSTWKITLGSILPIQISKPLGQFYRDAPGRRLDRYADGAREGNHQVLAHHQESGAAALLPTRDAPQRFAGAPVQYFATHQVGLKELPRFQGRSFTFGDPHFGSGQALRILDSIHTAEFEDQGVIVEPRGFHGVAFAREEFARAKQMDLLQSLEAFGFAAERQC